ncbi:MAG: efflux transporter outer membrane subunit [Kiritimatiellae bacterium]|nr:efflux transporter outer membrane subunit [Kiritimatiellia bacterium]
MTTRKKLLGCAAVLAAAGCAYLPSVGPDYEQVDFEIPATPLPDAGMPTTNRTEIGEYRTAEGDDDLRVEVSTNNIVAWWGKFDDPVLTNLVASAVDGNRTYLMAMERLAQSRWTLLGTYAAFLPKVGLSASATRSERGPNTSSMWSSRSKLHRDVFSAGFDASWEIDIFGGSRRATEAAMADAMAAEWRLSDAWVSLTAEVARRYIDLRTTQQRIAVARTNLVLQSETYDILKSRLDSGIGDELAVNQSKYVVDQTHARIPTLVAQEEKLKNSLAVLAGKMPGALHEELSTCPQRDWIIAPMKFASIPLDMLRARPDVRMAEREFAAEVARIGVAKSLWYPKFYINGTLGLESVKAQKLFERDSLFGSIGPSISWPIFRGGSIYANVKAQEARMHEKCLAYELQLQNAYAEVRDVYAAYTQEYHRYQALQGAVKAAQDAVSIAKDLYKNGLRDFTAVIDAQRSLLNLEEELVVSRGQITQNAISLFKALGGGAE